MVIPCLCSFTVPSSPSSEPPANKKRTRTLSRKESGSSTNCMVDGTGLEPDSLRKRVRVRFLFIGSSAEGLHRALNEQRQGITMTVVSCLLL